MREYSLRFQEGSAKNPRTITFQSEDAHEAFSIIERKKLDGPVEILEGDKTLGTIIQSSNGAWVVGGIRNSGRSDG
ncbi:hypothetical protein [Croceicoccus bisphenolivorans]|uniref:hypothetical protein n=1 Tax=Croceicoccus bisphenolivorans TaxID=1783232 RepID=UPI0012E87A9A|nr:hypothetical protein [Croceicoccus bisphenolivorans]